MKYIKSPITYIGNKRSSLDIIIPTFSKVSKFVDLFAGGLNVGINAPADVLYVNDCSTYLIDVYKLFRELPTDTILREIHSRIENYKVSKTNVEGYNRLRAEYNNSRYPLDLFLLSCYSFNNIIRFTSEHKFNASLGKGHRSYGRLAEKRLIKFCEVLKSRDVVFSSVDFREFDFSPIGEGDIVYCDPPYLISDAPYNKEKCFGGWSEKDDIELLELLDNLNDRGVLFALSNVLCHKRESNDRLIEWSKKYKVTYIDKSYTHCSPNLLSRENNTVEVLISNFEGRPPEYKQVELF